MCVFVSVCVCVYISKRVCFHVRPAASQGANEAFGLTEGQDGPHGDAYGNPSQDSTLMMREVGDLSEPPRRPPAERRGGGLGKGERLTGSLAWCVFVWLWANPPLDRCFPVGPSELPLKPPSPSQTPPLSNLNTHLSLQ